MEAEEVAIKMVQNSKFLVNFWSMLFKMKKKKTNDTEEASIVKQIAKFHRLRIAIYT